MITLPSIGGKSSNLALGSSGIYSSAWDTPKVVMDNSILHSVFTHGINDRQWKETIDGVEQSTFTADVTTVDGMLSLKSGEVLDQVRVLDTFRHPRYQPNRGHVWSASLIFPNPTALGWRDAGYFTEESGYFFRVKSDGIYACKQTFSGGVPGPVTEEPIAALPDGYDPAKGYTYDIQMQWRGVGNVFFYIGDMTTGKSKLVHIMSHLGIVTSLSIWNPANPAAFRCINKGDNVEILCGCVDISSEGGDDNGLFYDSIDVDNESGQIPITGYNVPVLAVRRSLTINGRRNTIDLHAFSISGYADQRCILRVWTTRDWTAITPNDQSWIDKGYGIEFISYDTPDVVTPMTFDPNKAVNTYTGRVPLDGTLTSDALFGGKGNIHQTAGDLFVFTMHRENGQGATVGSVYEYGIAL